MELQQRPIRQPGATDAKESFYTKQWRGAADWPSARHDIVDALARHQPCEAERNQIISKLAIDWTTPNGPKLSGILAYQ
jgi:hypothetical protein